MPDTLYVDPLEGAVGAEQVAVVQAGVEGEVRLGGQPTGHQYHAPVMSNSFLSSFQTFIEFYGH